MKINVTSVMTLDRSTVPTHSEPENYLNDHLIYRVNSTYFFVPRLFTFLERCSDEQCRRAAEGEVSERLARERQKEAERGREGKKVGKRERREIEKECVIGLLSSTSDGNQ